MSKFQPKTIAETTGSNSFSIIADGAISGAGLPVVIYMRDGSYHGVNKALAAGSDLQGVDYGISIAAIASLASGVVITQGDAKLAASAGTADRAIVAISSAGTATVKTFASAILADTIYGVKGSGVNVVLGW